MPFELHRAQAMFQRLVDEVSRRADSYTVAYIDDIVVFSVTWEYQIQHLSAYLQQILKLD